VCVNLPHDQQLTDVRIQETACWSHVLGNALTQQYCNVLLLGFSVGRSIRNSPLLSNGWRNCEVSRVVVSRSVRTYKRNTQAEPELVSSNQLPVASYRLVSLVV
jgi:hypothetical protein